MIVIFSGSSGVGKSTIINKLIREDGDKYMFMPTVTTRKKRDSEVEGLHYYFVSEKEFEKKIKQDEFYEYERVHGNMYGTSKTVLDGLLNQDKVLLKDIDVFGTANLKNAVGGKIKIITIFVVVASKEVLAARLKARGELNIDLRISRVETENGFAAKYDYVITNENLDKTVQVVKNIINKERVE
jgi:guanylate kinase